MTDSPSRLDTIKPFPYSWNRTIYPFGEFTLNNPLKTGTIKLEIPAKLDVKEVVKRVTTDKTSPRYREMLNELAETALKTARPEGIYRVSQILNNDGEKVNIDGVIFTSKVLSKLFAGSNTVIPFVVTGGKELMEMAAAKGDMMKQFYLDTIKTLITANAVQYLREYVQKKYDMPKNALMNPGEIEDWHITEQKPLFSLLGDVEKLIGVTLTEGGVMKPIKSRSGIIFPNERGFETCHLCVQLKCPGRRVKFDPEMYKQYLGKGAKAL
jgi:hypothetical protein